MSEANYTIHQLHGAFTAGRRRGEQEIKTEEAPQAEPNSDAAHENAMAVAAILHAVRGELWRQINSGTRPCHVWDAAAEIDIEVHAAWDDSLALPEKEFEITQRMIKAAAMACRIVIDVVPHQIKHHTVYF